MVNTKNKLRNILLYCGLEKENYLKVKKDAYILNFNLWKYINILVFVAGLIALYTAVDMKESIGSIVFRSCVSVYSLIIAILFFTTIKKDSYIGQLLINISGFILYAMAIIISYQEPDLPAVSFIVCTVAVQLIIIDIPLKVLIVDIIVYSIYFGIMSKIKSEKAFETDLLNILIYGFAAFIFSCYLTYIRLREAVTNLKLEEERTDVIHKQKEELEIKQVELEKALFESNLASQAKSNFLFNMSHDIRTPMNAIMGFTDLAIKNVNDPNKALDCLQKTKNSSEHLLSLINDILDMSRIEAGKTEINESPINLKNIVDNQISMLNTLAEKKEIILNSHIENVTNNYLFADHLKLNQIIINLVSNAVKYTQEKGSVDYTIKQLPYDKEGFALISFEIKDTGVGMEKSFLPKIFEEFSREKTSTVSKQQGTGLGLAITKRFVDMMGGTITVDSEIGVGSTFTAIIPFKIQDNPEENDQLIISSEIESDDSLEGKKCLLVEDNELNREISVEILQDVGFIVDSAEDGSIAVNMVKEKGPKYYDFILMDIQMPVMDGYQATAELRKNFPDVHIPIIALSANAFEEDKRKSLDAGMNDHQSKPIVISILIDSIKKLLRNK